MAEVGMGTMSLSVSEIPIPGEELRMERMLEIWELKISVEVGTR